MFLYKEEKIQRNTQGKRLGKDGADYSDTATCQRMSKITSNRQKLGIEQILSQSLPKEPTVPDTLIFGLWSPVL